MSNVGKIYLSPRDEWVLEIGKHFNQSWFAIYKSCKDINDEYSQFYGHVLKDVKKVLSK